MLIHRVNSNFYTFVCWDNETDVVDLLSEYEIDDECLERINAGTLTDENKADLIENIRCSLECGTQLCGKILDDCGQEINTRQDIYRIMGVSEEDVLRECWENQWENEGIQFETATEIERNKCNPEFFWLGRCGKYLFVGYGWSC